MDKHELSHESAVLNYYEFFDQVLLSGAFADSSRSRTTTSSGRCRTSFAHLLTPKLFLRMQTIYFSTPTDCLYFIYFILFILYLSRSYLSTTLPWISVSLSFPTWTKKNTSYEFNPITDVLFHHLSATKNQKTFLLFSLHIENNKDK